jgi:MFS family permease
VSAFATHPAKPAWITNRWWVVFGAVAGLTVCNGPVLLFTSGVFLKPIAADMQWRRSTVSFALSLAAFTSALATPILGRMMDRWGIRGVALPGLALFAASLAVLSLSPRSPAAFVFSPHLRALSAACRRRCPTQRPFRPGSTIVAASRLASPWRGSG